MNTHQKGSVTELEVMLAIKRLGYAVSIPYGNSDRYDLVADIDGQLIRIQCKTAEVAEDGNAFRIDGRNSRYYKGTTRHIYYNLDEIDYFATTNNGKCYLVPVNECHRGIRLRHQTTSNQVKGINWAEDYELEKVIEQIKGDQ